MGRTGIATPRIGNFRQQRARHDRIGHRRMFSAIRLERLPARKRTIVQHGTSSSYENGFYGAIPQAERIWKPHEETGCESEENESEEIRKIEFGFDHDFVNEQLRIVIRFAACLTCLSCHITVLVTRGFMQHVYAMLLKDRFVVTV